MFEPFTPPTELGASVLLTPPGNSDAEGKLPGRNAFEKLNTLNMLALGWMVKRSRILIGQDARRSMDLSHGKFWAPGASGASVGITQPRAFMSACVITAIEAAPGQRPSLTRQCPAGV